jgi:hypothetical protein
MPIGTTHSRRRTPRKSADLTEIPLEEIWRALTTQQIGFYTDETSSKIPETAGIYAWFFPLTLGDEPQALLALVKTLLSYDTKAKGVGERQTDKLGFTWDPLLVSIRRDVSVKETKYRRQRWQAIKSSGSEHTTALARALYASTIFARPLYVGLTNDLKRRHGEHVDGRDGESCFHSRFTEFAESLQRRELLQSRLTVRQLLFACIPMPAARDEAGQFDVSSIELAEDLLKNICQPVFGDR